MKLSETMAYITSGFSMLMGCILKYEQAKYIAVIGKRSM